jgi:hypothetical protein
MLINARSSPCRTLVCFFAGGAAGAASLLLLPRLDLVQSVSLASLSGWSAAFYRLARNPDLSLKDKVGHGFVVSALALLVTASTVGTCFALSGSIWK